MPPRAMWTGQVRLSLVSFGVRLYAATESAKRVAMNQLHKDCHQRVRNQLVCPNHGPVARDDIVKGYEYEKDSYVIVPQDDIDSIKLKSSKVIDLIQFVNADEIDALYVNAPYFLGPDGPVAEEAFRVIREAMQRSGKVGIGKLIMHGREHIVAMQVNGKGFLLTTLRYASEVREGDQFFSDLKDGEVDEQQVELAQSIMDSKAAKFNPREFIDQYQEAFFDLVKAKIDGEQPVFVEDDETPKAFNFMEALKRSVADVEAERESGAAAGRKKVSKKKKTAPKKPAAKSVGGGVKKKRKRA